MISIPEKYQPGGVTGIIPLTPARLAAMGRNETQRIILRNHQCPGDIIMLTAALRDLHLAYPGRFLTGVQTTCAELWHNNPYVFRHPAGDARVRTIDCHYNLINESDRIPCHFVEAFGAYLAEVLGLRRGIKTTAFKGDLYLLPQEREAPSILQELTGLDLPFWIIVGGGKTDYPLQRWSPERWQAIVDHFAGKICFVQIAERSRNHVHPRLRGAIDLRGETTLRQLMRLMYHAQGVVCPVTMAMHMAAAVETKDGNLRPCVVINGGREAAHWVQYPGHQFLHTIGALPCCGRGGCWKSRLTPRDANDTDICADPRGDLPHCMEMITPEKVCAAIESYFEGGAARYLTPAEWRTITGSGAFEPSNRGRYKQDDWPLPVRLLVRLQQPEDFGIGDIVARTLDPVGGDAFKKIYHDLTGADCGCADRQETLNRKYPLK